MPSEITELFIDLDRSGPVPLYYQIARRIEDAIERGELLPGARLENEVKLADQLGLSRPTVRQAIQELVDSGLLVRRRGVGTQVVHGRITRKVELTSLYDDLERSQQRPSTRLLMHETAVPPEEIIEALSLERGQAVLHLRRLRYADGVPFALLENYLAPDFADITREQLEHRGLYQILRSRGASMRVAKQRIGARKADAEESRLFGHPEGSPVLTMSRTLYDDSGRAIEHGLHSYLPELYSFEVTLVER